jgi:SNF2 family DNA or RNA helicase
MSNIPPLYDHQKKAISLLEDKDVFALLAEMGTGKSRMVIEDWVRRKNLDLLVFAPKGVVRNWIGEIQQYVPDMSNIDVVYWISGANKKELSDINRIVLPSQKRRVFLVNIESMSTVKAAQKAVDAFTKSGHVMCVVDESTRIKSWTSSRTKHVINLGSKIRYKRILSGLVTPNSPMDLFSQFLFLDWRILGFQNYYTFRARYAIMKRMVFGGRSVETIVGYKNLEELQEKIKPYSFRILKDECLDLPAKIYTERSVELSTEQEKAYKEMVKNATTMLESGEFVTSSTAISLLLRLHQIVCGHVRNDQGVVREIDAAPREQELLQTLEECGGKAIIWATYRPTIVRLAKIIRQSYDDRALVEFWGDTTSDNRELAKERFQTDAKCLFFLGNPSTAGLGLTLTQAKYVVYYANDYNLENRLQSEDRAHRAGLKHPVTYVDLVAKNTIDEKILKALRNKINMATTITGEKLREWIR